MKIVECSSDSAEEVVEWPRRPICQIHHTSSRHCEECGGRLYYLRIASMVEVLRHAPGQRGC